MGQAIRTTKLQLDLGKRTSGGANTEKRTYLVKPLAGRDLVDCSLGIKNCRGCPLMRSGNTCCVFWERSAFARKSHELRNEI